jgi:hypothetical protein
MHGVLIGIGVAVLVVWLALVLLKVAFKVIHLLIVAAVILVVWGLLTH